MFFSPVNGKDKARQMQEMQRIMECTSGRRVTTTSPRPGIVQVKFAAFPTPRDLLVSSAIGNVPATKGILNKHPQWVNKSLLLHSSVI